MLLAVGAFSFIQTEVGTEESDATGFDRSLFGGASLSSENDEEPLSSEVPVDKMCMKVT